METQAKKWWILGGGVWLVGEMFLRFPQQIFWWIALEIILVIWFSLPFAKKSRRQQIQSLVFPLLFQVYLFAFVVLQTEIWLIHLLLLLNGCLVGRYFYLVNKALAEENLKYEYIGNFVLFGNLLLFFFAASAWLGLQSFLGMAVWRLAISAAISVGAIVYSVLWALGIDWKRVAPFIFLLSLSLVEIFWALTFWPLNYAASGLVLTICFYVAIGLVKHYLLDTLDKGVIKMYLGVSGVAILLILFTARWL